MADRNPVAVMDSVEAMDLMGYAHRVLKQWPSDPAKLDRLKEQILRHGRALKRYIYGGFERVDDPDPPQKQLTVKKKNSKVTPRRKK